MIASAMVSIGLAAVLTAYGSANSLELHQVTSAMHLAEGRLEELLLQFPDSEDLKAKDHTPLRFKADGTATTTPAAVFFSVDWTVSPGPIPRTRRLDVTVTWGEDRGPQQLTLSTHRS